MYAFLLEKYLLNQPYFKPTESLEILETLMLFDYNKFPQIFYKSIQFTALGRLYSSNNCK